jgi:fructose-1,6-bisphosphatase I
MQTVFRKIREIALEIDRAIREEDLGYSENCNASGDEQLKLDVVCDNLIEHSLKELPLVKAIISEEKDGILQINPDGGIYTVCYDPLDGSSIVDVNLSVGSIFGIYEGEPSGKTLRAAAYVVYGPRLEIVTAVRGGDVRHYRSDSGGLFNRLCDIRLKERGKLNAPGGTQKNWFEHHRKFVDSLFDEGYRLRYSGGMVPDLHQILLKGGGIFSYPGTTDKPKGKLRALFEVIPFALIYETAGGEAVDDRGMPLLELSPTHPHDTTPCFFGSSYEISRLKDAYGIRE